MASDSESLAALGRRYANIAVRELGQTLSQLGTEYSSGLAEYGFGPEKLNELNTKTNEITSWLSSREEKMEDAHAATRAESEAAKKAAALLKTVAKAGPIVLRDQGIKDVAAESFKPKGRSARTTPEVVKQIAEVRPFVQRLDDSLKPYFRGESPTVLLDNALAELDAADKAQEARRGDTPEITSKLQETKGRVLELVDDLICVAQIAFEKQPDVAARFNKSILERGRKKKNAKSDKGSAASTTVTTPTPSDSGKTD